MEKKRSFQYAWLIAGISFLTIFVSLGLCNSPHGLYQIPVTESTRMTRTQFSTISTFRFSATAVFNFLFGYISRKLSLRNIGSLGLVCLSTALILFSFGNSAPLFYLGGALLGVGSAFATTAFVSAVIANWFVTKKGTVLGVVLCASGLGGTLFSQFVTNWIKNSGWRVSYRISAALVFIVAVLTFLLIRDTPAEKGVLPFGYGEAKREEDGKQTALTGMTLAEAKKTGVFYIVLLVAFFIGFLNNPIYVAVPAQMADKGFTPDQSALVSSLLFLSIAVAKIALGAVHDRIGLKKTVSICFFASFIGLGLLLTAKSMLNYVLFAIVFGLSLPLENLIISLIMGSLFGKREYATFVGMGLALTSIGIAVGNRLMGFCYDKFGTYLYVTAGCLILSVLTYITLCIVLKKERKTV